MNLCARVCVLMLDLWGGVKQRKKEKAGFEVQQGEESVEIKLKRRKNGKFYL